MSNPSIFYEIFCAVFLLCLGFILLYFVYKESKRAEERHYTYIETMKSFAHSLKEIQIDVQNCVGQYIKNSMYD